MGQKTSSVRLKQQGVYLLMKAELGCLQAWWDPGAGLISCGTVLTLAVHRLSLTLPTWGHIRTQWLPRAQPRGPEPLLSSQGWLLTASNGLMLTPNPVSDQKGQTQESQLSSNPWWGAGPP